MKKRYIYFSVACILLLLFQNLIFSSYRNSEDQIHRKQFNKQYGIFSLVQPEEISFCDERLPISDNHTWERLDKQLLRNTYFQSNTLLYLKRAGKYFPIIEPILRKNNIPDDFKYLAVIESGLENVVSPSGASGFWQIMEVTAQEYGLEINEEVDERYHLEKSTKAACKYLLEAYDIFGSWTMVAASYNMGKTGLKKQSEKQQSNNYYNLHLNSETGAYIFRILAIKEILQNPRKYGFYIRDKDFYILNKVKKISLKKDNVDLIKYSKELGVNYKLLKTYNPWLRKDYLTNPKNKEYKIQIPESTKGLVFKEIK